MSDKRTIAVLGLGAMGSRMAENLITSGYPVVVYNRSEAPAVALQEKGAIGAASPAEAAGKADVIIAIVTNNEASEAIWLAEGSGAIHGMHSDKIAVTSSTLTPEWSETLGQEMSARGIPFLEAPVVGTRPQAEQGELVYLVGGQEEQLNTVRDVFDVLGSKVLHMGHVGDAMRMKLVINAMLGIQAAALGEALHLLRSSMANPQQAIELFKVLPVMSPLMTRLMVKMEPGNFNPNFPIELVEKDLGYFVRALGKEQGEPSFVEATREIYAKAADAGYGKDDITGIIQLFGVH